MVGGRCLCWLGSQGLFPAWLPLGPTSPLNMGRISPLPGLRQPPWASVTCNSPNPQQRVVAGRLRNLLSRLSSHPWKRKEGEGCGTSWGDWAPAQCCRPEAPGKTLSEGFTDLSRGEAHGRPAGPSRRGQAPSDAIYCLHPRPQGITSRAFHHSEPKTFSFIHQTRLPCLLCAGRCSRQRDCAGLSVYSSSHPLSVLCAGQAELLRTDRITGPLASDCQCDQLMGGRSEGRRERPGINSSCSCPASVSLQDGPTDARLLGVYSLLPPSSGLIGRSSTAVTACDI